MYDNVTTYYEDVEHALLEYNGFISLDLEEYEMHALGSPSADLGVSERGYVNIVTLTNSNGKEINNTLFAQIFPQIKGREALVSYAKQFSVEVSESLLSAYAKELEDDGFEKKDNKYHKTKDGIFYIYAYVPNEKMAYWIVAREDMRNDFTTLL
ncbi:MAG: hypothetical protein LBT96_01305 [Campylobacteraceae bacterium]|nr:hypothetical protein [Campylobacteraceae bacterium]